MPRKFKVGDVVRLKPDFDCARDFERDYGRGPFIIGRKGNYLDYWYLLNMNGTEQTLPGGGDSWRTSERYLIKDEFLTAAIRANNQTKKEKTRERKDQKKRAVGNH